MAAPHNKFTEAQIEELRSNRYVRSVGERFVFFTDEFKRLYWQMHEEEHLMPVEILRKLGVNYHTLGVSRVRGLTQGIKRQLGQATELTDAASARGLTKPRERSPEQETERLRAENEYLRQENEFLKKILAAGGEVKR
jgi:transposase-like protein